METLSHLSFKDIVPFIGSDKNKVADILQSYGIQQKRAEYLASELEGAWKNYDDVPYEKKLWALQHGFLPGRVELYGLTESNYKDYLSDIDYFYLHPLNNHFAIWINDKITLKYVIPSVFTTLEGRRLSIMPEYYLYIENDGRYTYLMDSPKNIMHDEDYLLNLLKEKSILALKPSRGQGGHGFVMLRYIAEEDKIYANDKELTEKDFNTFKETLDGYIVTEYVKQHKSLDAVWKDSVCTLRVVALNHSDDKFSGGKSEVIAAYARFGTSISSGASNLSSGGVAVSFDFNTGLFGKEFFMYPKFSPNGEFKFPYHPDTKVSLFGNELPHWDIVRDVTLSVCDYLSSLEYFGFDIMVTDGGVKICEINTLPALTGVQVLCGPVLHNASVKDFFYKKMRIRQNK